MLLPLCAALLTLLSAATLGPARAANQSALEPRGNHAAVIADLSWVLFVGGGVIFVVVMLLAALAMFAPASLRAMLGQRKLIIGGGIVFPVVVLSALLVYSLMAASTLVNAEKPEAARVEVTGEMWWWRVRYLDGDGKPQMETANEIRIPAGRPVDLLLISNEVIHSFWVPNLAGKIDMIPGHVNKLRIQADTPGIFRGQCAEYCGAQHANMAFHVVAMAPSEYEAWLVAQRAPAREPHTAQLQAGKQYFMPTCARCHTVRGTEAAGKLGPDLTHVGSRTSLAAGTLPNNIGAMAGWIAGSQQIKPENRMPSFNELSGEGLRAVAAYTESLK
jgi:cytochrome c oxidase subunit 2